MALFVLCISLIILGFGAVGILAPLRLINFVIGFDNLRGLYVAAAFRIIFGLALIYIAKATHWPEFLHILGLFTIAAGFVLLLLGLERFHKIVVWRCGQRVGMLRIWSFFALLLGGFLVYVVWGALGS
jgi:hypothetical protein